VAVAKSSFAGVVLDVAVVIAVEEMEWIGVEAAVIEFVVGAVAVVVGCNTEWIGLHMSTNLDVLGDGVGYGSLSDKSDDLPL